MSMRLRITISAELFLLQECCWPGGRGGGQPSGEQDQDHDHVHLMDDMVEFGTLVKVIMVHIALMVLPGQGNQEDQQGGGGDGDLLGGQAGHQRGETRHVHEEVGIPLRLQDLPTTRGREFGEGRNYSLCEGDAAEDQPGQVRGQVRVVAHGLPAGAAQVVGRLLQARGDGPLRPEVRPGRHPGWAAQGGRCQGHLVKHLP